MTIKVFECTSHWDEIPVTIFAHDLDEVEQIYRGWIATHHPDRPEEPEMIYAYGGSRLEARPRLAAASALNVPGVGWWDRQQQRWCVADPQDKPAGDLTPPETQVSCYRVDSDPCDDAMVFATKIAEAAKLYCEWHVDRWGEQPSGFTIHTKSRWDLTGELASLRDDVDSGMTGVAGWDNNGVLRILPPNWEPAHRRE